MWKLNAKPPAIVSYTNDMPDITVNAHTKGFYVRIRPDYMNDVGIHMHEYEHVKLFYYTLGLHLFLTRIRAYRLWNEARAYYKQSHYDDAHGNFLLKRQAAVIMATHDRYNFKMTESEIYNYLTEHFPHWYEDEELKLKIRAEGKSV